MIGYKKVYVNKRNQYGEYSVPYVLKLEIVGAVVKRDWVRKMRTSEARVIEAYRVRLVQQARVYAWDFAVAVKKPIRNKNTVFTSIWDKTFNYRIGQTAKPNLPFNSNIREDCGSGIHFYLTKKEAANH